ncbi:DNA primase [Sphingomonas gilva]|uniref:DNA primase n=1 Tax=Sphingomonas gilva TaxID=2305907 RepID=A0A396S0D5_9SPHN|nr:DNA primase [Sphingomonas gilva]RHW19441.1 DNA primase [Sphingomonas gilva]
MGGRHVIGHGTGDDGFDEEGYDESQRAEILEFEREGRTDGTIVTDLDPDLGEDEDLMDDEDKIEAIEDTDLGESDDEEDENADEEDR